MDQYIGKLLDGRYELLERIGSGGMAVVYKARCHRLNRLVAVKILKPDLAGDAEFRRRFHDESQAVAMLSHANIMSVYDVSSSEDLDYIVMELIDGITLKQYMHKRGVPLNWREALHFIIQIVKALGHAHSRGIIHRDIKPHNVMVLRDGSIKVADFGIARLISGGHSTLTQEALGSVHYISPEQARGSRIDGRSDLYSAGVVLYEMITGRLPFEGETPVSVAIQHINSIPIPPRELNPELPAALEAITIKAMAPNVDQRYPSAGAMLADLEDFRRNPNITFDFSSEEKEEEEDTGGGDEPTRRVTVSQPLPVLEEEEEEPGEEMEETEEEIEPVSQKRTRPARREEPDYDDDRGGRAAGVIAGIAAVLVILLFIGGMAYFLWQSFLRPLLEEPETYQVPSVLGMTLSEIYADRSITATFQILEGEPVYDENYELGEVVRQSPAPGSTVREGNQSITVYLNTELEEEEMRMPDVYNWDARRAVDVLQDEMGLVVKQIEEASDTITSGYVMRFTPIADVIVQPGDEVTLVISKGRDTLDISVPLVEGVELEEAKRMLTDFDLVVGSVHPIHSETVAEGLVVFQSIRPATEVPKGTVVNLQVSLGSANPVETDDPEPDESTDVPDVPVATVTKEVAFSLEGYTGTIHLKVVVGGILVMDGAVDTSIGTWSSPVSHSGLQTAEFYVDGVLVTTEVIDFSE